MASTKAAIGHSDWSLHTVSPAFCSLTKVCPLIKEITTPRTPCFGETPDALFAASIVMSRRLQDRRIRRAVLADLDKCEKPAGPEMRRH